MQLRSMFSFGTFLTRSPSTSIARCLSTTSPTWTKRAMPPRPGPIPEEEFTEVFLKGTGPGGQKINKTSSAVQLKHLPTGLVLKVQATRSRTQNRKIARQMLADKIEEMEKGAESRIAIVRDVKSRKKSSAAKKSRRKYRALEEAKREAAGEVEEGSEIDEEVEDVESGGERGAGVGESGKMG